jgi:hypothetical protein
LRRAFTFVVLLASTSLPLLAQTAAHQALNNEPEVQQIERMNAELRRQQGLPNGDVNKPSLGGMAVNSTASLRQMGVLLDGAGFTMRLAGMTPDESRWSNIRFAICEVTNGLGDLRPRPSAGKVLAAVPGSCQHSPNGGERCVKSPV